MFRKHQNARLYLKLVMKKIFGSTELVQEILCVNFEWRTYSFLLPEGAPNEIRVQQHVFFDQRPFGHRLRINSVVEDEHIC